MSRTILYGFDKPLVQWACERIPWASPSDAMRAVGVATGPDATDDLLAVALYYDYREPKVINGKEWYNTVEMGIAAKTPSWATRGVIYALLHIPFRQYKVRKVRLVCPSTNKRAIRFAEGIGFKPEGTLRHEYADGVHACVLGLLRKEFERADFLRRKKPPQRSKTQAHGQQEFRISTASA